MAVPTYTHRNPLIRWIFWQRHRHIFRLAALQPNQRVLDFGTGTGALLPSLCSVTENIHATDLRDDIARYLVARRGLRVTFHSPRNLNTALSDNSFDVIIAADVLEHIEEPELSEYLRLFGRKLIKQGRLIVSIPTENSLYKVGRLIAGFSGKAHYHRTGMRELHTAACASGLIETASVRLPLPGPACFFRIVSYTKNNNGI
jgi:2-polyprenyl-3-methyl-5-hydroxy-6-metoxy-1,4-benzoquinol methylase